MAAFFIIEEGTLTRRVFRFEEGNEWIIGRDPNTCSHLFEGPTVSRKHAILRLTKTGYLFESLSTINPARLNNHPITEPTILQEGDSIQIGDVSCRFTEKDPGIIDEEEVIEEIEDDTPTIYEEPEELEPLTFSRETDVRWIIKVISGPNAGAEFGIHLGASYIMGKDPNLSDFVFQDLTVSAQHAKLTADVSGTITIEDLGSKNNILINGLEISEPTELNTQDLIALGTTSLLIIDRRQTRSTIVAPSVDQQRPISLKEEKEEVAPSTPPSKEISLKHWKQMTIPVRHLILVAVFALLLIVSVGGMLSLFKSEKITISTEDEPHQINQILKGFPEVEHAFTSSTGKLFILGHVMTEVDHQEMVYLIHSLPFIKSLEDNVVTDELVWGSTNPLLMKNPAWRGVTLTSVTPGHFVLRGYVQTLEETIKLSEYMNLNFSYLDKLDNQVVVESTLGVQIQSILTGNRFINVTFQFANGEVILAGRIGNNKAKELSKTIEQLKKIRGIRLVKNFVVFTQPISDMTDITSQYTVTGNSKYGNTNQYIVINGKILSKGDNLDGMSITKINDRTVFLEKNGIKYKINYNQQ